MYTVSQFHKDFPHKWERVCYRLGSALTFTLMPLVLIATIFAGLHVINPQTGEVLFKMVWVTYPLLALLLAVILGMGWLIRRCYNRRLAEVENLKASR